MWIINRFCNFKENKRKLKRLNKMLGVFESHFWHPYCLLSECVENDTVRWYTCTFLFIISGGFFFVRSSLRWKHNFLTPTMQRRVLPSTPKTRWIACWSPLLYEQRYRPQILRQDSGVVVSPRTNFITGSKIHESVLLWGYSNIRLRGE